MLCLFKRKPDIVFQVLLLKLCHKFQYSVYEIIHFLITINNIIGFNGDAIIISEKQSGKDIDNRAEFKKLLNKVKPGDTIIFDEVSRMSRNADEGFSLYMELLSKGHKRGGGANDSF